MKPLRLVACLVVAATAAIGVQAYTAANTVTTSTAGVGAGAVSGYAATAVSYTLNTTNPSTVDAVSFTLSPTSTANVKARLFDTGSWYNCTNTAGSVSCATTLGGSVPVASVANLTVVATS